MPKVPFAPLITASTAGGSQILDRLMHQTRRTFDSLDHSYVAKPADAGSNGQALILGSDGQPIWSSRVYSPDDSEQVTSDLVPTLQFSELLPNGATDVRVVALQRSRHYWLTASLTAFDTTETVVYTQTQLVRVRNNSGNVAVHLTPDTILHTAGVGFTLLASVTTGAVTFSTANASGADATIQVLVSAQSARTRS